MFVYAIVNRENQKVYIGRTVKKSLRAYLRHKVWSALTKRYNGRSYLFNAMQKYPSHVWSIHPLISCLTTEWQLDLWEKAMIYAFDSTNPNIGYNICKGGAGHKRDRMKGHPTSPETINKIKAARALQDETPRVEGCRKYAKEHKEEMSARLSHEAHVLGGRAGAREAKQRAAKVSIRRGSQVIGSAIALNLLFHIPLLIGVCLTALDVLAILYLQNKGFRYLEALVVALIGTIGVCYLVEILLAG